MKVIIDDVSWDTPANLTYRERRLIKEVTGLDGIEWLGAVQTLSDDVALGYAAVVLHRNGSYPGADSMLDRQISSITLDLSEEIALLREQEAESRPPADAGAEAAAAAKSPARSKSSGRSTTRRRSGTPSSPTS